MVDISPEPIERCPKCGTLIVGAIEVGFDGPRWHRLKPCGHEIEVEATPVEDENFTGVPDPPDDFTYEEGVGWRYGWQAAQRDARAEIAALQDRIDCLEDRVWRRIEQSEG